MREVISLNIGQAGVQIGGVLWELYCREHGLDLEGNRLSEAPTNICHMQTAVNLGDTSNEPQSGLNAEKSVTSIGKNDEASTQLGGGFHSFFEEMSTGNYSPRSIIVDLEPTVVDEIRTGRYKGLFSPSNIINGNEDAANNYARGMHTAGKKIMDQVVEGTRKMAERSEKLQGFLSTHSFGGGTGSGFASSLTQYLADEYNKKCRLEVAVFPSPTMSTAVVEPYNAVLTTSATLDLTDCVFLADNEAMYKICVNELDIDSPKYSNLNHLLAQTISSITSSLRFQGTLLTSEETNPAIRGFEFNSITPESHVSTNVSGTLNADFSDFQTNLVPYPRIHFPVMSYAPIVSKKKSIHQTQTVGDITSKCFDGTNRLAKCDNETGCYMACCILYRGDVTSKEVYQATSQIKQKKGVKFVQWSPSGFKHGINSSCPMAIDGSDMVFGLRAACLLSNTTAIKDAWSRLNSKYHVMLKKKAFTHWYISEGMEMSDFFEAQDNVLTLEDDYELLVKSDEVKEQ
ncbi:unnamed protein product [Nesidiocoris tenuis]|uniref:Tubulin alpha chain n=1 Tax=Nesidiocoris tenuis TaxID=355587 RepID=A0A6H5H2J2_9HEMI|nr:unnamed protein product [Nesidiocoris tenuis]